MPRLGVDVRDVNIEDFPVYPDGVYQVQVEGYKDMVKNDKRLLRWTFKIVNHPEYNGKPMIYDTYMHTTDAMFKLKRLAVACNALLPDGDIDTDQIQSKVISVTVTTETHRRDTGEPLQKPRNQVDVNL
jgi:hypothetical protein